MTIPQSANMAGMAIAPNYTISQHDVALSARRPVRAQWLNVALPVKPHDHAYHEICLVLAGTVIHHTADRNSRLNAGHITVVPPRAVHSLTPVASVAVVNVYYLAEWLATDLATLWAEPNLVPLFLSRSIIGPATDGDIDEFALTDAEVSDVSDELRDIDRESRDEAASNALIRGAFLKVLARLSRASLRSMSHRPYLRPEVWKTIQYIERLVQSTLPLDVAGLAEGSGLSADYLGRLFTATMGRTIGDYYQLRRVHRACQLLMNPQYSITEVALETGYSDAPHLCRMFKRYRDMSPMAYRAAYAPRP